MKLVYKFLPPERTTFFSDGLLRYTQPAALNDPFECIPVFTPQKVVDLKVGYLHRKREELLAKSGRKKWELRLIDKILKKAAIAFDRNIAANPERFHERFFRAAEIKLNSRLGILSLSRRWNSSLMWAHYSSSHTGICVGLDANADYFTKSEGSPDGSAVLTPVVYNHKRVLLPTGVGENIGLNVMFRKSTEWSYEEEERLIALLDLAVETKSTPPFAVYLFRVPLGIVREVIVGARASKQVELAARNFCAIHKLPLFLSRMSEETFDMERTILP